MKRFAFIVLGLIVALGIPSATVHADSLTATLHASGLTCHDAICEADNVASWYSQWIGFNKTLQAGQYLTMVQNLRIYVDPANAGRMINNLPQAAPNFDLVDVSVAQQHQFEGPQDLYIITVFSKYRVTNNTNVFNPGSRSYFVSGNFFTEITGANVFSDSQSASTEINQQIQQNTANMQQNVSDSQTSGTQAQTDFQNGSQSLLSTIGSFFGAITNSTVANNCNIVIPQTFIQSFNIDFCSLQVPSQIQTLAGIAGSIAIGLWAFHFFNRILNYYREEQDG